MVSVSGVSHARPGTAGYNVLGDARPAASLKSQLQRRSAASTPADVAHAELIKRENHDLAIGKPRNPDLPKTMWDHLRDFHYHNRNLSIAAGMCSIVALSTALGLATGWVIDELAHITDRKNDKVGLVIGLFVGLATAFTQTASLFGMARKFEFRTRALAVSRDTTSIEGQCFWYIAQRSPVMAAAMIRNGRALRGEQHQNLEFHNTHVLDGMNLCIEEGWKRADWKNCFEEYDELPAGETRPYWRCTADAPASDFKLGKVYVCKHRSAREFLSEENLASFDLSETRRSELIEAAQRAAKAAEASGTSSVAEGRAAFERELESSLRSYFYSSHGRNENFDLEKIKAAFYDSKPGCSYKAALDTVYAAASKTRTLGEFNNRRKNEGGETLEARDAARFLDKLISIADPDGNAIGKSFSRVDEIEKVKVLFSGMREASLHTFLANIRDSLAAVMKTATSGESQGNVAGLQIFMFLPLTIAAAVVSVLCLGVSPMAGTQAARGNGMNGQGQNGNPSIVVFPSFEGGAAPQGATPLMQALNQSSNYQAPPAFSTIG